MPTHRRKYLIIGLTVVIVTSAVFIIYSRSHTEKDVGSVKTADIAPAATTVAQPTPSPAPTPSAFAEPVAEFKSRITKKPFGAYITPQNSPVQPEKFTGYHTGADAEYQDITTDVPVLAIADGTIVLSKTASGYGGVFIISFELDGTTHTALYGHIRPSTLPKVGQKFQKGEQIGLLGTNNSTETDGERRHLHFAILSDSRLDIKGYVANKSQLSGWLDPLGIF